MRSRLVIPAALLIAAAYVKGRWDGAAPAAAGEPAMPAPPTGSTPAPRPAPAAEAAATLAPAPAPAPARDRPADAGPDLAVLAEWSALPAPAPRARRSAAPGDPELALMGEWTAPVAPPRRAEFSVPPSVVARGRFSLGGWAAAAGHIAVAGVTFRERLEVPVDAGSVRLVADGRDNVADGGLVVLADPGFAPDGEGFTLMLAAAGPGAFAATGTYEVLAL